MPGQVLVPAAWLVTSLIVYGVLRYNWPMRNRVVLAAIAILTLPLWAVAFGLGR